MQFGISSSSFADPIPTKHRQGSLHGFVVLKDEAGKITAIGDQINVSDGNLVRSRLVLHFRDGSIDEERTVFTQGKFLQVVSDHHIQKGQSFKQPLDLEVDVSTGTVTTRQIKDGKVEVRTEHMDIPADLANGMISPVLANYPSDAPEVKVSYLAGDSKPRLVKLSIKPEEQDSFRVGGVRRRARRFNVHIELGGIAGVVAPVIGKQPSDIKIWVMDGEVPTFLRMRGPLYQQGPIWTAELASPVWTDR